MEQEKQNQLENKWWHRLIKVIIYFLTISTFFFVWVISIAENEPVVLAVLGSLFFSALLYLILNVIYHRAILYIAYGKSEYIQSWSLLKTGIFILAIAFLFGLMQGISYLQKDGSVGEELSSESEKIEIGKDIEIEITEVKNMGSEYGGARWIITTEGKFIYTEVSLKNIGKESISVAWGLGHLIDDQERKFYKYGQSLPSLPFQKVDIAPGLSDTREAIYETPLDAKPAKLEISSLEFENQLLEIKSSID